MLADSIASFSGRPSDALELVLVRHASSTRAQIGVWGRLYDAPLADGFEQQLARTRVELSELGNLPLMSSPLRRCIQTAQYLFPGKPLEVVPDFRAFHSGLFEGATEDYIARNHPEYLTLSFKDRFLEPRFNEESVALQLMRVARGLHRVLQRADQTIVIVTHYSTLNVIANLGVRIWDLDAHASGAYDVALGGYFRLWVNPRVVLADIEEFLGHQL